MTANIKKECGVAKIASAANADTAAFAVLWAQGYELEIRRISDHEYLVAKKGDDEFLGETALVVLGLIAMFESRGRDWTPTDREVNRVIEFEDRNTGPRTE